MNFWKVALMLSFVITGCESGVEYSQYVSLSDGWNKDKPVTFSFEPTDTLSQRNIFIMLRNDQRYPYSNLFLITRMEMPDRQIIVDTLEYEMANAQGEWLGYGYSGVKESKLWYKEGVAFPVRGKYLFKIEQAMRKNGENEGINILDGITEVGIRIENDTKETKK
ncbi:MAG: gliding motility lipoprotein GldH [Capnocytophaga sp.]|nr:gliding motility lipoprotein GldH [Capnocytophaga sp.]